MLNALPRRTALRLLLITAALLPTAAAADLLLISRVSIGEAPARAAYLWVGESALRYDDGQQALIADFASRRVHLLDHAKRTVTSGDIETTAAALPVIQAQPSTTQVRRWTASEYLLQWPEYGLSTRVFTSQVEGIDAGLFSRTVRKLTGVPGAQWLAAMAELPGIPVRIETTRSHADGSSAILIRDTVNIMQRTPPVATYRVPAAYKPQ